MTPISKTRHDPLVHSILDEQLRLSPRHPAIELPAGKILCHAWVSSGPEPVRRDLEQDLRLVLAAACTEEQA
jgi:hypothetical protein